jgi:CRP-like cAMP-binding protein
MMSIRHQRTPKQQNRVSPILRPSPPDFRSRRQGPAESHRANRLLAALEHHEFRQLESHLELADLSAGTVLYEAGDRVEHAYFPHGAVISLVAVLEDGRSAEVAVFGCEGVFGFASSVVLREAFGRYLVQIPGTASRIPVERLQEAADAIPSLRELLRRYVEALLAQTFQTVACNAVHSVDARCCRWILGTFDRVGRKDLPLTHEFLAEMLGVQRSTVSIVTRSLQGRGLIEQRRGSIMVTDHAGLEQAACECHGAIRRSFDRLLPRTSSGR